MFPGSLRGTGQSLYSPACQATSTYTHRGVLSGPGSVDFDLYLQKLNGSTWTTVASGLGYTRPEDVSYSGHARHLPLARLLLPRLRELHAANHVTHNHMI